MLKVMINIPTIIINALDGILLHMYAASGAAVTPPIIKPRIICHCTNPIIVMKVATSVIVTKNSARFTVPIVNRGLCPLATRVDVTIGPQPPPPIASKKPPIKPNGNSLALEVVVSSVFLNAYA